MNTTHYEDVDIKVTSWTNVELGTTHGYRFPCGACFPSEFFTRTEAVERHNTNKCLRCDKINRDLRQANNAFNGLSGDFRSA